MSDEGRHWFEDIADHLGAAYLRYSFTKGTDQEVGHLCAALGLTAGDRLLDVGCGPGRHARAFAARGIEVVGVDISARFVELASADAPPGTRFERADARKLTFDAEFDAAVSLCQGAFGLTHHDTTPAWPDPDGAVLASMARALRPGGRFALTAFSAYFQVRHLEPSDAFDADRGVNREDTAVRDEGGRAVPAVLWTGCFTPRELRLLCAVSGLAVDAVHAVTPGAYADGPVDLDHPELLVRGHRAEAGPVRPPW